MSQVGTAYVTLKELSSELGLDRSNLRRYILKHGIDMQQVRTPESRNQLTLAVSADAADEIRSLRLTEGFTSRDVPASTTMSRDVGVLYMLRLDPIRPGRIKLGFTNDMEARLRDYQVSQPEVETLATWPCWRSWEKTAITAITNMAAKPITTEIFDVEDVDGLMKRGGKFFRMMPDPEKMVANGA